VCGSYDIFKQSVTSITGGDELSPSVGEKFIAGAAAGAFSQVSPIPLYTLPSNNPDFKLIVRLPPHVFSSSDLDLPTGNHQDPSGSLYHRRVRYCVRCHRQHRQGWR
jgi:hypothetical protein